MMMPFFRDIKKNRKRIRHSTLTTIQSLFAPLQVRIRWYKAGKRALSWASRRQRGSLTLEAALCLPLFLFASFCLMMPVKMMDRQRQIQAAAETVGEELSRYAYLGRLLEKGQDDEVDEGRGEEESSLLTAGYAAAGILARIDNRWIEQVSFEGTEIGEDDLVKIVMKYRMPLPFSVLGLNSVPVETVCIRRMWTGAEGKRWSNVSEDGTEETVYIGKSSTRYHRRASCHYLYNDLEAVPAEDIETMRNKEGKIYYPCKVCAVGMSGGNVYVMPYGTSYHYTGSCSAISAYVQAVPLSQAEYLGACSYCGGE